MPNDTVQSNITILKLREEDADGVLITGGVWRTLEPNSYSDFGGDTGMVSRTPISASRQRKRGSLVSLDATAGFEHDFLPLPLLRFMQSFFFATTREKPDTARINEVGEVTFTNVDGATDRYQADAGLGIFRNGHLVNATGFTLDGNNGIKRLSAVSAFEVTVAQDLLTEVPPAAGRLEAVGFQFPTADVTLTVGGGLITLTSTSITMNNHSLVPGEWLYMGDTAGANNFVAVDGNGDPVNRGFVRFLEATADTWVFDLATFQAVNDVSTAKTPRFYWGKVLKNENTTALIAEKRFQAERQLGSDENGVQSEYILSCVGNEFTLTVGTEDKLICTMNFVGLDVEQRDGLTGIKTGTREAFLDEKLYNTSTDVVASNLYIIPASDITPSALAAYASDISISINNGVTPNKAIGVLGGFSYAYGDFVVDSAGTFYFDDMRAVTAVRNNSDCGQYFICARDNAGFVFDIPMLGLSDGRNNVEKDQPIKLELNSAAARNQHDFTLMFCSFSFLPSVAYS